MKRLVSIFIILLIGFSAEAQRLIPFLPEPGQATGAAVVVCPGAAISGLVAKLKGRKWQKSLEKMELPHSFFTIGMLEPDFSYSALWRSRRPITRKLCKTFRMP